MTSIIPEKRASYFASLSRWRLAKQLQGLGEPPGSFA